MFDPNQQRIQCELYLNQTLGARVELIRATRLPQSTREAPWRLDVKLDGISHSFVLYIDSDGLEQEYRVMKAVEPLPIATPRVYGLDLQGEALGRACFFSDFIEGESLLGPVQAGEAWAEQLYIDSVCALQAITGEQLGSVASSLKRETALDVLEEAYSTLKTKSLPVADAAYQELISRLPVFPTICFSNGDLWLDNFIVQDRKLGGVIDFQNATFSDPIYEFLLSFFVAPDLRGRGTEARFCQKIGCDPAILQWYHGLEYLDTWRWVLVTGESFVHHTAESLEMNLQTWLTEVQVSG